MKIPHGMSIVWAVLLFVLLGGAQPASAADFPGSAKVEHQLLETLAQHGEADYIVYLQEKANLAGAQAMTDRNAQGRLVYRALKEVADRTQAPLRAYLAAESQAGRANKVKSFVSVNAMGVSSGEPTLRGLAAFPGVERIILAPVVSIPEPSAGVEEPKVNGIEWNINKVRAPEVWAKGIFGQGVVVANIDTGVQFDHPALVNQYRGNLGGGSFDHNYNWWDPSVICSGASPCDNNGHGSHTMGTMVGDDGGGNKIGVAPQAPWMACKGCESNSCSGFALLECGDFILAPWNANGANPNPDKRPHVVNNSWGGEGGDSWYQGVVQSWRAAGIFPAFSNGNAGPGCNTSGSPGDYPESFSSGATDINDAIASFSSRGPSVFGIKKPDISTPGVSIRSSVPTSRYASFSGTSMASPHTAGMVALLWSLYPGLSRDIPNTEAKLRAATQILNTSQGCGGEGNTVHPNNVFGWGRGDAFQAYTPLNIYTNSSVYQAGNLMNVFLSLVNPLNAAIPLDIYVAILLPNGQLLFFPGLGTTPVPYAASLNVTPLMEVFDHPMLSHTFGGESAGNYTWFAVATLPGADPMNPANWLSLDDAPFQKQ